LLRPWGEVHSGLIQASSFAFGRGEG